jgi:hypothetical protein
MVEDKRLESLQEEIKLMKGELKQSLASVRDYLLNMELPSSEISNILSALGSDGQNMTMKGTLEAPKESPQEEPEDMLTETEESVEDEEVPGDDLLDLENPEEEETEEETTTPEDNLAEEATREEEAVPEEEAIAPEEELATPEEELVAPEEIGEEEPEPAEPEMTAEEEQPMQEEQPMEYENPTDDTGLSVPKVNMLANLINWVARANKEIGRDNIATFLEVYGISGHLSPELKDVILHLSEIAENEAEISGSTEIWSQAMLLLHGILTGGDAPLHPATPAWNNEEKPAAEEEIIEVDKTKDKSVKLKLVLPDGEGESKEFCINLTPEADGSKDKAK